MSENTGLYQKFSVKRIDGRDAPGGDREGAEYFTLDLTHDPFAKIALMAYADACENELPLLADAIRAKYPRLARLPPT